MRNKFIGLTLLLLAGTSYAVRVQQSPTASGLDLTPTSVTTSGNITVQGNAFSVGGSTLVVSGGKVGIGTASPQSTLDVRGSFSWGTTATSTGGTNGSLTMGGLLDTGVQKIKIGQAGAGHGYMYSPLSLYVNIDSDNDSTTEKFIWGTNGSGVPTDAQTLMSLDESAVLVIGNSVLKSTFSAGGLALAGPMRPGVKTLAQLQAITPAVGDTYSCSDCTNTYTICVGTGAVVFGFREVGTATGCK